MSLLGGSDSNSSSGWGASSSSASSSTATAAATASGWGSAATTSSSGWNSTASWGRNGPESSSNESVSQSQQSLLQPQQQRSVSPKPLSSWARAVSGPNTVSQVVVPGNCSSNNSRSHCDKNSAEASKTTTELEKEIRSVPAPVDPLLLQADNWGQTVINQDNAWDLPSPQDPNASRQQHENSSMWKSTTAGTEIWENSVRHKNNSHNKLGAGVAVQPAATAVAAGASASSSHSSSQSSSWNHTPTSHIGGTWGEEEDTSSVWTGVPQTNGSSNGSHSHSSTSNASNGSWGGNPIRPADAIPDPHAVLSSSSSSWKERRSEAAELLQRPDGGSGGGGGPGLMGRSNLMQNHSHQQPAPPPAPHPTSSWNGSASMSWDDSQPPAERLGTSGWAADPHPPVQKPTVLLRPDPHPAPNPGWKKEERSSGWDVEPRVLLPNGIDKRAEQGTGPDGAEKNIDDGTAAWGNPTRQPAKIHRWKEEEEQLAVDSHQLPQSNVNVNAKMSAANSANGMSAPISPNGVSMLSSPGMIRLPPASAKEAAWIKAQQTPQTGPWNEVAGRESWNENNVDRNVSRGWGDSPSSLWSREQQPPRKANWSDGQIDTSSWNGPKHKPLTKEMICASKQFRVLSELGFRKDDVETSLRSANMNAEEALSELRSWAADERRKTSPGNTPTSLLTGLAPNPSLSALSRSSGLPQAFPSVNEVTSALRGQASRGGAGQANLPSEKQLLHLVQQIQLAVQTGHLNAQILNQPLAPPTIQLIYTLLQQIKHLQQLQIQVANSMSKPGANNASYQSHLHVQITQTKQRISNCQNQIAVQQALFMKHQQVPAAAPLDFLRNSDPNSSSLSEFRDLSLKDQHQQQPSQSQNQSRFKTTWKLPSFEKDDVDMFSRAPGCGSAVSKSRPDTWSALNDDAGLSNWSDGNDMFKETNSQANSHSQPTSSYLADLVPEFEPGKPWKGSSQMKNIEDDPHVTPGSVNRSPLSVNTIFNNWSSKVSPTDAAPTATSDPLTSLSLSSSTWAFPPSSSGFTSDSMNSSQKVSSSWSSIGEQPSSTTDSLWSGSVSVSKPRGPPPGLSQSSLSQVNKTSAAQQQVSAGGSPAPATGQLSFWDNSSNSVQQGQQQRWTEPRTSSGFLVLRNLTPQIDGSTLKTLCLQHGPVRLFHLLLQNGICLVQYTTQEEANKAQSALNNCVLGNTTILSHVPTESELKQLGHQAVQSAPASWASSSAASSHVLSQSSQNGGPGYRPGSGLGFNASANGNKSSSGGGNGDGSWGGGGGGGGSGGGLWNYSGGSSAWDERSGGSGSGLQSNLDDLLGGESN